MRDYYITVGSTVLADGYHMIVTGYNGSIVYLDEYDDDFHKTGERMLTLNEIAHVMHQYYGKNFNVIWKDKFD